MTEEDSGKLVSDETRPALCDLTNLPAKRGISSILGDLLHKSEDGSGKTIAHGGPREKFSKRLCLVVDDLVKENASARPVDTVQGSCSDNKNSSGDSDDKTSEESHDAMVEISSGDDGNDRYKYSKSVEIYFEPGDRDGARELNVAANVNQTDVTGEEALALSVLTSNTEKPNQTDFTGEGLALSVSTECQSLRSFEMSRCSNVNKEHVNQNMGDDLFNSCSCSFCLKAAFIWSDLHYQDIKGRLSAVKKSQKEASKLIQRNGKERPTDFHATVNSVSYEKLDSKLTGQWKSLFLSMGDILAHESNHLQNSFVTMNKLREDCKMDLERATKKPQHKT